MHRNNFHLLRLIAAAQVAVVHTCTHMGFSVGWIEAFPGVPVFFVISGFLVSESYERSTTYALNRFLRIYPGLWGCLAISILIVYFAGFTVDGVWVVAQMTIVQFWNPDYLRDFGVGVLNGSLWTIPVEIQFYIALPVIYWALRSNGTLVAAIAIGACINAAYPLLPVSFGQKLIGVSLPTYLYLFLIGVILQKNREFVSQALAGKLPMWLMIYGVVELAANNVGFRVTGNFINPISALALAMLVISAAHARALPLKHDISYGIYLYHMPVANAFIERGSNNLAASLAITFALACASWFLIERPALSLKHLVRAPGDLKPGSSNANQRQGVI